MELLEFEQKFINNVKTLNEIDRDLSVFSQSYDNIIEELVFETIGEFNTSTLQEKSEFLKDLNYQGIYLIEIKNSTDFKSFNEWISSFQELWGKHKFFTPNIKKKRISQHLKLNDWIPLYIGKSKGIGGRVEEHVFKTLDKTTFALKLKERGNLNLETFRLKTIRLDVNNYDTILPIIERRLRDKINPIIGKQ